MTLLDERPVGGLDERPPVDPRSGSRTGRLASWRFAARLARREVRRRPGRTALVAALIAVPIVAMTVGVNVVRTASNTPQEVFEQSYGQADISIFLGGVPIEPVRARLPAGARDATMTTTFTTLTTAGQELVQNVDFRVIPFGDPLVEGIVELTDGRYPNGPGEVLVQQDVADDLGVAIGETFELDRPSGTWEVVGIGRTASYLENRLFALSEFDADRLRAEIGTTTMLVDVPAGIDANDLQASPLTASERASIGVSPAYVDSIGLEQFDHDENIRVDTLAWGWVAGAIALAAVGVIIAAAFASSARRQLATIGQLSANGASEHLVRRTLALQGAWTGAIGATIGVVIGLVLTPLARPLAEQAVDHSLGPWHLDAGSLLVILCTGIAAATIAAMVPARSAARVPVLSALAGRRPLAKVPRRLVPIGLALFGAGTALLVLVTIASSNDRNGGGSENIYAAAAIIGGLTVMAGMCCASPVAVDLIGGAGSRFGATWRLASRSVARSRTRSAGVLTAIAVAGTAAIAITTAVGSLAFGDEQSIPVTPRDTVVLTSSRYDEDGSTDTSDGDEVMSRVSAVPVPTEVVERLNSIVPGATTTDRWYAIPPTGVDMRSSRFSSLLVADATTLGMLGLSDSDREVLERTGFLDTSNWSADPNDPATYVETIDTVSGPVEVEVAFVQDPARSRAGYWGAVITPDRAGELGLEVVDVGDVLVSPSDLTADQRSALDELQQDLWTVSNDAFVEPGDAPASSVDDGTFVDTRLSFESTSIAFPRALVDAIAVIVMLVLTLLVVGIGLSLAATESRDERDVLVAVGAKPRTLRGLAGTKAVVLTIGAAALAIPTGFIPVAAVLAASSSDGDIVFPWLTALGLLIVVPLLAGLAALGTSALAQRVRPVTMSTLAAD